MAWTELEDPERAVAGDEPTDDTKAEIERRWKAMQAAKTAKFRAGNPAPSLDYDEMTAALGDDAGAGLDRKRYHEKRKEKNVVELKAVTLYAGRPEGLSERQWEMLEAARAIEAEGGVPTAGAAAKRAGISIGGATNHVQSIQRKDPSLWPWPAGRPGPLGVNHAPKPTPRRDSPALVSAAAPPADAPPRSNGHSGSEQSRPRAPEPRPVDPGPASDVAGGEPETATEGAIIDTDGRIVDLRPVSKWHGQEPETATEPELTAVASSAPRFSAPAWDALAAKLGVTEELELEQTDDQVVNVARALKALSPEVRRAVLVFAMAWEG